MREKQTRQASGREHTKACRVSRGPAVAYTRTIWGGRSRKGWKQPGSLRLDTATKSRLALPLKNAYSHTKLAHQPGKARR